ncbi:MAG: peptidoglycan-binding protein LysM [Shimia sp.]
MLNRIIAAAAAGLTLWAGAAAAETCGGTYRVKSGDSLSRIADVLYKDAGKWSAIHQANIGTIGDRPERITIGMKLNMTCIDGLPVGLEGGVDVAEVTRSSFTPLQIAPGNAMNKRKIQLLTADDYAPFTDRNLPNGGLYTEVVNAAMTHVAPDQGFAINWVNDWSSHLEPLLSNALLDMGFPWSQPNCTAQPDTYRCQNVVFSEPLFEMLMLAFVANDRAFGFYEDTDMVGKRVCRPAGYATYLFDEDGRNWLTDELIELSQPPNIDDCFTMLMAGSVDAVVMNEFTGRKKIAEMGLSGAISPALGKPVAIDGLHVVAHKSHPDAEALMGLINDGIAGIRASGEYQRIIDTHMARIWAEF